MGGAFLTNFQYAVMYYGSIQASKKLHSSRFPWGPITAGSLTFTSEMLESVLFAKLRFHDTTSRGRLLNRFGKDVEGLDSSTADNCTSPFVGLADPLVVRSLEYGLAVAVTFVSITYVGGLPFVVAGW
jgi:hypothetical protein